MSETRTAVPPLSIAQTAFIVFLFATGFGLMGWSFYQFLNKPAPKPNLAAGAEKLLRYHKAVPLSEPLETLLGDPNLFVVESQKHPLIGKPAPDFLLLNHRNEPIKLSRLLEKGPVVLVFYYGYWCDHCVAQLFGIDEDLKKFKELGASVVAISGDSREITADRFKEYGEFSFPVVEDTQSLVAETYGVLQPGDGTKKPDNLQHGTFIISRDGIVRWAELDDVPFLHNQTLLYQLAKLEGRLPTPSK